MSDRIPGSSYDNPIWYGKWKIYIGSYFPYEYIHDDYDGEEDNRFGFCASIEECKQQINEWELDHA